MSDPRRWIVLCVVLMGTFMTILDVAIVNVAIPSIRSDLGASFGTIGGGRYNPNKASFLRPTDALDLVRENP